LIIKRNNNKIECYNNKLNKVDNKLNNVDNNLNSVDNNLNNVDNKLNKVDTKLNSIDNKLNKVDNIDVNTIDTKYKINVRKNSIVIKNSENTFDEIIHLKKLKQYQVVADRIFLISNNKLHIINFY
ncbi:hypothetical protein SLOPH_847, partial [Spraguea lophii 42_110]